jgi:hypothetical protein
MGGSSILLRHDSPCPHSRCESAGVLVPFCPQSTPCHHHPPSHPKCETGGSLFFLTIAPALAPNTSWQGSLFFSVDNHTMSPPPPCHKHETGGFSILLCHDSPRPHSKHESVGVLVLFCRQPHHVTTPPPRHKHKTGGFSILLCHNSPCPHSECESVGVLVLFCPQPHHVTAPSLTQRGSLSCM